jgi:hypothetical protein
MLSAQFDDWDKCMEQREDTSTPPSSRTPQHRDESFPPIKAFINLERTIRYEPESPTPTGMVLRPKLRTVLEDEPLVILEFDEAHTMITRPTDPKAEWSNFSQLRRALRALKSVSLFSLFLSTTGKMNQFVPSATQDRSTRIMMRELYLFQPFTDLGFDQFAKKIVLDGGLTIHQITHDDYVARFGRPMYVLLYNL